MCESRNSTADCTQLFISQPVDHFSFSNSRFQERYFVCSSEFRAGGPLFFYTGNESPVEAYVNNTGLMWESAPSFGALLIFAEHRYYGKSQVFEDCGKDSMRFLQANQAMADFASLIEYTRSQWLFTDVITFGGSYGGMLSAYMRMRYPQIVSGAIAASAPIFSLIGLSPPPNEFAFNDIIAKDAGPVCASNVRDAFTQFAQLSESEHGRIKLSSIFKTCRQLQSLNEAKAFGNYLQDAWATLAMGDYPYESSYMTDTQGTGDTAPLPAFPMQVACTKFTGDPLESMREAVGVFYNASGMLHCLGLDTQDAIAKRKTGHGRFMDQCGSWDYQYCGEFLMPFSSRGDLFYPPNSFNAPDVIQQCAEKYNVTSQISDPVIEYGGYSSVGLASNIFFSNGDLDPWTAFGVDCDSVACGDDVTSMTVIRGAHHLDLMFSNSSDPPSVLIVRNAQVEAIRRWTTHTYSNNVQIVTT